MRSDATDQRDSRLLAEGSTQSPLPTEALVFLDLDSLIEAGRSAHLSGDFREGRDILQRALDQAYVSGDSAAMADALTWLGQGARRLGDYDDARRLGEQALAIKLRQGLEGALFDSYNALGLIAWEETRLAEAAGLYERAQAAAAQSGDSVNLSKVAANRALVHLDMGNFREARIGLSRSLELARHVGDERVETLVLLNLATLDEKVGRPARAKGRLVEALALSRDGGDRSAEAYALGELAVVHQSLGEPGAAFAHMDSALAISRLQGNRQDEAENLSLLAGLHRQAGRYRRALELLSDAGQLHEELGLTGDLASDLRQEAEIHALLGNFGAARERAEDALQAHTRDGIRFEQLSDMLLLAELSQRDGRHQEVERWITTARRLAEKLDARAARIGLALTEARIAMAGGHPERALSVLDEADGAYGVGGSAAEIATLRAQALAASGDLDSALEASATAVTALERTRRGYGSPVLRTSFLADRAEVYALRVSLFVRLGRVEEAFEVADGTRGRALLERLASVADDPSSPTSPIAEVARAEELLSWIDTLVARVEALDLMDRAEGAASDSEAELLSAELERTRADYEEALIRATESDPSGAELLGVSAATAAHVRRALGPDEALIEYYAAQDSLFAFIVNRDAVRVFTTPVDAASLRSRIRVARDLVARADGHVPGRASVLSGLHRTFLGAVRAGGALDGIRRLYVIPEPDMSYLPFAALRDGPEGPYVAERFTVTHLPSARALPALRQRVIPRYSTVAGSSFAPFPVELPGTAREVEAVREEVAGWRVVAGSQATETAFREALEDGNIVHAATHGILNAWNPMFSRILLQAGPGSSAREDGRMELHEILTAPMNSPLVFLSGCETGLGTAGSTGFAGSEDYSTLAQAFLYAGAQNVIATLWRIEDDGAAAFAERFFHELADDSDPARALAAAQRVTLRDPRFASPFYWAGYRLDGSGGFGREAPSDRPAQESGPGAVPAR